MLVLRKCHKDGSSRNNFVYGNVGDRVTCPDWNSDDECGNGLHGLLNCNGNWNLLDGRDWILIEADDQIVVIDKYKCKFNTGVILYRNLDPSGMIKLIDVEKLNSNTAYRWALEIGNRDIMIDRITESRDAYYWAHRIGNRDIMIDRVTESTYAYLWARNIGNKDIMIDRVTESEYAYRWAENIGNRDIMIDRVTESWYAYYWACDIGNKDIMIDRVTESKDAYDWARNIGDENIMINRITDSSWILEWNLYFPNNQIKS